MSDTVKLKEGDFKWETIEGRGECLVPAVKRHRTVRCRSVEALQHELARLGDPGRCLQWLPKNGVPGQDGQFITMIDTGDTIYLAERDWRQ